MVDVPAAARHVLWRKANQAVDFTRNLTAGSLGPLLPAVKKPVWKAALPSQRTICEMILGRWAEWAVVVAEAPGASAACSQLLGPTSLGYEGFSADTSPLNGELDSQGRPKLPKGSLCDVDVEELALPEPGTKTVDLVDISPEAKEYFSAMEGRMLVQSDAFDKTSYDAQRVYQDAGLKPKKIMLRLAERLWRAGALEFTETCVETLSLFGVVKKYDDEGRRSIRPVWDERKANHRWAPPPFVPLGSPMCFCHLDLSDLEADDTIYHVAADIPDMFTRLRTPPQAWPYFVLSGVLVDDFVAFMKEKGEHVSVMPGCRFAAVSVLVMGWSWAPFLAHSALIALLDLAHGKDGEQHRMVYGHPVPQFDKTFRELILSWGYIDDLGAAQVGKKSAPLPPELRAWRNKSVDTLASVGLPVHKESAAEGVEALGAVLTRDPCRVSVAMRKVYLLVLATDEVVRKTVCTVKTLERILGLWGWVILFARPALAILDRVYHFVRGADRKKPHKLPAEVLRELRCLSALAPFFATCLSLPWHKRVYATDSSDFGYGVVVTTSSVDEIREEARYCELRGWTVCLEDQHANIEESVWADQNESADDIVHDAFAAMPLRPLKTKCFRILHLFSGFRRKGDLEWWIRVLAERSPFHVEVYSIDLAVDKAMDLTKDEVVGDFEAACREGFFHAAAAGPPCNTWARARFNTRTPGPRPLRTRAEPWGRSDIVFTASERRKVDLGTSLLLATIKLVRALCSSGGVALVEHPRDPGVAPYPSIWAVDAMTSLLDDTKGHLMLIDQCMYGLAAKKATTIGIFGLHASDPKVQATLKRQCRHKFHSVVLQGLNEDGSFKTSLAQVYPSGLCRAMALSLLAALRLMFGDGAGSDDLRATGSLTFPPAQGQRARPEQKRGDRVPAPPLSSSWARLDRWKLLYRGLWKNHEHINVQELRVVTGLLRHLARGPLNWKSKVLVLTDSMVALGAGAKGRSSSSPLLRLCRQMLPLQLILEMRVLLRYIPSEMNPSDGPSRMLPVGAAEETVRAHSDRASSSTSSLPVLSAASALRLLRLGRKEEGFAGG